MVTYENTLNVSLPIVSIYGVIRCGSAANNNDTLSTKFQARQSLTVPFYVGGLAAGEYCLSTFATMTNGTALSGTSDVGFQILPDGSLYIGETTDLVLVKAPVMPTIGIERVVQTGYLNSLNFSATAIVWAVFHNNAGQTVAYSTSTIVPQGGETLIANNFIVGLPPGTYSATIFATSVSFVAISNSTAFTFTIPSL
jgi:hypothetical protein